MHKFIPTNSTKDPLVTSQSDVWCKRTDVSHLVVKLIYRCRLVRLTVTVTPYACSPEIDGSVLTVVVSECIVDHELQLCNLWSSSPDCDVVSVANRLDRWSQPCHISYVIVF